MEELKSLHPRIDARPFRRDEHIEQTNTDIFSQYRFEPVSRASFHQAVTAVRDIVAGPADREIIQHALHSEDVAVSNLETYGRVSAVFGDGYALYRIGDRFHDVKIQDRLLLHPGRHCFVISKAREDVRRIQEATIVSTEDPETAVVKNILGEVRIPAPFLALSSTQRNAALLMAYSSLPFEDIAPILGRTAAELYRIEALLYQRVRVENRSALQAYARLTEEEQSLFGRPKKEAVDLSANPEYEKISRYPEPAFFSYLTEREKQVARLVCYTDWSPKEIADFLGIALVACKHYFSKIIEEGGTPDRVSLRMEHDPELQNLPPYEAFLKSFSGRRRTVGELLLTAMTMKEISEQTGILPTALATLANEIFRAVGMGSREGYINYAERLKARST